MKVHRVGDQAKVTIPAWQTQGDWADLRLVMDGRIYFIRLNAAEQLSLYMDLQKVPVPKEKE